MEQLQMLKTDRRRESDALPAGYSFVTHSDAYIPDWIRLITEGIGPGWTEEHFRTNMTGREGILPEGIFYIVHNNSDVVATATGIIEKDKTGFLHMVSVDKNHRGLGLSAPLSACAINYMYDNKMENIKLTTDDFRIPAIKTYLKLGFIPVFSDETMPGRWKEFAAKNWIGKLPAIENGVLVENILS